MEKKGENKRKTFCVRQCDGKHKCKSREARECTRIPYTYGVFNRCHRCTGCMCTLKIKKEKKLAKFICFNYVFVDVEKIEQIMTWRKHGPHCMRLSGKFIINRTGCIFKMRLTERVVEFAYAKWVISNDELFRKLYRKLFRE